MTRLLILVAIVVGLLWWLFGRKRNDGGAADAGGTSSKPTGRPKARVPAQIVACVHCGVHLPRDEAVADAQGRLFCGEAHRLAGPR